MTQEEKARAYEEALKNAKRLYEQGTITESLAYIFPELKGSEDEKIRKELIDAIQGLWDNDALPMPLSVKRKDRWIAWLEKQGEQKQEWSEEDKEMFDRIDESLYYYATKLRCEKDYSLADAVKEEQSWLFSLKNRIQPQPKQEWSDEDEKMTNDLIEGCLSSEKAYHLAHSSKEIADWLKSLKNRIGG